MKDSYFYSFLGGFAAGVASRSFFNLGISFAFFMIFLSIIFFLCARFSDNASLFLLTACFLSASSIGILRFERAEHFNRVFSLQNHVGETVFLRGVISDEADERENSTRLTVTLKKFTAKVLLVSDLYPAYDYGDEIEFSGKLEKPKNFSAGNERQFDYVSYLAKEGIQFQMYRPKITLISHNHGNPIVSGLFNIKHTFIDSVQKLLPMPHSALLSGLTIGAKQSLGNDLLEDFRKAGVIHIVVLSGYNITIIALFVMWIFSFLPRRASFALGALSIILFAIMTGGSATIVRASIMALLVVLAKATARTYDMTRALLLAGFFMILHNPKILVFDISFQLSFLATVALIYFAPIVERRLIFLPEKFHFREVATATIAAQIFVLPFLLYTMGQFSLVALPVNLLILFFIPATMLFGFLAGMIGFVSALIAAPFAWIAYALLAYELVVVEWFSHLPFASVSIPVFPFWIVVAAYVLYFIVIFRRSDRLD